MKFELLTCIQIGFGSWPEFKKGEVVKVNAESIIATEWPTSLCCTAVFRIASCCHLLTNNVRIPNVIFLFENGSHLVRGFELETTALN